MSMTRMSSQSISLKPNKIIDYVIKNSDSKEITEAKLNKVFFGRDLHKTENKYPSI